MKKYLTQIAVFSAISLVFFSCRDSDRNLDKTIKASQESSIATNLLMDAFYAVHHVAIEDTIVNAPQDSVQTNTKDGCVSLVAYSSSNGNFPKAIVLEFDGSSCKDGRVRSGRLSAKFSSRYSDTLATMTISFSSYTVDGITITGKQIITNKGKIEGSQYYTSEIQGVMLTSDTLRTELDASFTYQQTAGQSTIDTSDDEFEISGQSSGRITAGSSFSTVITTPLKTSTSCEWIYEGIVSVQPSGLQMRKVDFGSACDNEITITNLGKEFTAELP